MKLQLFLLLLSCLNHTDTGAQVPCGIVINEILFNPNKDGFDYLELLNTSYHDVDLSSLALANRNVTRDLSSIRRISKDRFTLTPGKYLVITSNEKWLRQNYYLPDSAVVCTMSSLPSLPDDEGSIIIMNLDDSSICEELSYSEKWHFSLLDNSSGIALERINATLNAQSPHNWMSASSSVGFGTPGYRNSQAALLETNTEYGPQVLPSVFTPDNDGIDDYVTLSLKGNYSGYVINSVIYDVSGRRVRYFLKNEMLGSLNFFRWDGLDDKQKSLPPGPYLFVSQVFNITGDSRKFKNVIVVGAYRKY